MQRIKAIPQNYAGVRLRSRAERHCAETLDRMGFEWEYEVEGVDLNGLWYLPDFWLPRCRTFVEVKGVWEDLDLEKVLRLWELCLPLDITVATAERVRNRTWFGLMRPTPADIEFGVGPSRATLDYTEVWSAVCLKCGRPWFLDMLGGFRCPNCGAWDGDHYVSVRYDSSTYISINGESPPRSWQWPCVNTDVYMYPFYPEPGEEELSVDDELNDEF